METFKGKADIVRPDCVIDLKTTYITNSFVYNWQYDSKLLDIRNKTYKKRGRFGREINTSIKQIKALNQLKPTENEK